MKAIQIEAFGKPAEVVKAVDIPDVGAPTVGRQVNRRSVVVIGASSSSTGAHVTAMKGDDT